MTDEARVAAQKQYWRLQRLQAFVCEKRAGVDIAANVPNRIIIECVDEVSRWFESNWGKTGVPNYGEDR
jgi:hypothetical protein